MKLKSMCCSLIIQENVRFQLYHIQLAQIKPYL